MKKKEDEKTKEIPNPKYQDENKRRKDAVEKENEFLKDYVQGKGSYVDDIDKQNLQTDIEKGNSDS